MKYTQAGDAAPRIRQSVLTHQRRKMGEALARERRAAQCKYVGHVPPSLWARLFTFLVAIFCFPWRHDI
jgi:hypothetical protein